MGTDFEDEDPTDFGQRTIVGPIVQPRAPAPRQRTHRVRMPAVQIQPRRRRIPIEWGIPFVTVEW